MQVDLVAAAVVTQRAIVLRRLDQQQREALVGLGGPDLERRDGGRDRLAALGQLGEDLVVGLGLAERLDALLL